MRFKKCRPVGERNHKHKLTTVQVQEIRRLRQTAGKGCRVLARQYGVCKTTIIKIVQRRTWRHV